MKTFYKFLVGASAALTISFTISSGKNAYAGYADTEWGMSLAQIKQFYPEGYANKEQNGQTTYGVVRPVGGQPTGYIRFTFSKNLKLEGVQVFFPEHDTKVDLKNGTFRPMGSDDAHILYKEMVDILKSKYGAPNKNLMNKISKKSPATIWLLKNGDVVILSIQPNTPDRFTVLIEYNKVSSSGELTKDL